MNKPVIAGVAIAALGIIAAVAIAARYGFANNNNGPEYAQVTSVEPVKQTTSARAVLSALSARTGLWEGHQVHTSSGETHLPGFLNPPLQ